MNSKVPLIPDFSQLTATLVEKCESSLLEWWQQTIQSPAFKEQLGAYLEQDSSMVEVQDNLEQLSRIIVLLEQELGSQKQQIDELNNRLVSLEKELIESRIEAVETELKNQEELTLLRSKLKNLKQRV